MNEPTPYGRPAEHQTAAVEVHTPATITPAHNIPLMPVQPGHIPAVASIVLPDGRVITGYAIEPTHPGQVAAKPTISRTAVNVALGGVGFLAVCGGLLMLTAFITALAALVTQLVILAAVVFGGWIAVQVFSASSNRGETTVHIRKAVIKRNRFYG